MSLNVQTIRKILEAVVMELKLIKADSDYTHVALSGRLDCDGVASITSDFADMVVDRGKPAIVDMTEVASVSASGMRMLLDAAEALQTHDAKLVLYNAQPLVLEVLQTAGFSASMPMESDLVRALALLKKS